MYYLNFSNKTTSNSYCVREETTEYKANRQYKDSLFRFIFGREENKQNLLDLYNALNNSDYKNIDDLQINTLDNVIYMSMKNDISFMLDSQMVLLEHQSTFNPNMPLRGFLYFAKLYESLIAVKLNRKTIYWPKLVKIPTPHFIVLYNGEDKDIGDSITLKLSDAFEYPDKTKSYEWTAKMINVNYGRNKDLLVKCKKLRDYSYFVDTVRKFFKKFEFSTAVDKAIDKCIKEEILTDILQKFRAEVKSMLLTEFDDEREWKLIAEGFEEIGFEKGREEEKKSIIKNMLSNGFSKETIIKSTGITEEDFNKIIVS